MVEIGILGFCDVVEGVIWIGVLVGKFSGNWVVIICKEFYIYYNCKILESLIFVICICI